MFKMEKIQYWCDDQETRAIIYGRFLELIRKREDYLTVINNSVDLLRVNADIQGKSLEVCLNPSLAIFKEPIFMIVSAVGSEAEIKHKFADLLTKMNLSLVI